MSGMASFYAIIPHASEPRILAMPQDGGWSLPRFRPDGTKWLVNSYHVNQAIQRELGVNVTVLHCAHDYRNSGSDNRMDSVYLMENHSPLWEPPAEGRWCSRDEIAGLPFNQPDQQTVIEACFAEAESDDAPEHRRPWERAGWYDPAVE